MDSKNFEPPSHHETAGPSNSGERVDVEPIFLSHSGCQKAFVEQLYDALTSANHSAFFDKHSLPKGSPFPSRIKQAALGCKLGVVVISDDFFMSKWPMIELDMLINQRGPDPMVLPLFYKLQPKDLKSSTNLAKWRSEWKEIKAGEYANRWEEVVHMLDSFNGEVFIEGSSVTAYIQKVVCRINDLVPCRVPYSVSSIQGHQRLVAQIAGIFEDVKAGSNEELACIVGLHGIGGLGKTTLCKCMINFYTASYLGRSCIIEFPSDGDKMKIMQECKRTLTKLTHMSIERLSNEAHSFDQVVHLMGKHVKRYDVFLAIDNVWESCREEAEKLLGVGFSAKSRILVTSRSERVLQDLLLERTQTSCVVPLPAPEHEEAFQIFQNTFKLGNLRCLVDRNEIDRALGRCRFNGTYHSLALKALAQYLQRVCVLEGLENIRHRLPAILKDISNADLQTVEKVIKLSYDIMPENKRHMFLDIVVLAIARPRIIGISVDWGTYAQAHRWLCVLYKEFRETNITHIMYELASDGLIQIRVDEDGDKMVDVHDLYVDLAQREAASSPRFFTENSSRSVKEMEWERLERARCLGEKDAWFFTKLQQEGCRKLQLLIADGINTRDGIRLGANLPSLCVLALRGMEVTPRKWRRWFTASGVLKLNGLVQLQTLELRRCNFAKRIGGLHALQNLQTLRFWGCPRLKSLDGVSGLIQLECLVVVECGSIKKIQDLRGFTRLRSLRLEGNGAMEEVGCLSSALEVVEVGSCNALRRMGNLGGLPRLEWVCLRWNVALEEVGGESLSSTLKRLIIFGQARRGGVLRKFPTWNHCVHLQALQIENEPVVLENGGIKWTTNNNHFNEQQWEHFTLLKLLILEAIGSIEKLEVGCLGSLTYLRVRDCKALEEMGDVSALHCLERLIIKECPRLKKVSGLVGILTHLKELQLLHCESLEASTIPDVSLLNDIKDGEISNCGHLKDWKAVGLTDT